MVVEMDTIRKSIEYYMNEPSEVISAVLNELVSFLFLVFYKTAFKPTGFWTSLCGGVTED